MADRGALFGELRGSCPPNGMLGHFRTFCAWFPSGAGAAVAPRKAELVREIFEANYSANGDSKCLAHLYGQVRPSAGAVPATPSAKTSRRSSIKGGGKSINRKWMRFLFWFHSKMPY